MSGTPAARSRIGRALAALLLAAAAPATTRAADVGGWLDDLADALEVRTPGGGAGARLDGDASLAVYSFVHRAPGLLQARDGALVAPRLSLDLTAFAGEHVQVEGLARFDRGFDPGERGLEARIDRYEVRWMQGTWVVLAAGKRPTAFGSWAVRHRSWENPLVTPPLPYDQVTTVSDGDAPATPQAFLARRRLHDRKARWVPLVWDSSYTSGFSATGRAGTLDWAAELRNRSLSSRPQTWGFEDTGLSAPTVSGRLGWTPTAAWTLGASGSHGPYLRDDAAPTLPRGRDPEHYGQTVVGADLAWARGPWQLWSELLLARFDVPNVGDADALGWYVEGRRKLGARVWLAARFAQLLFGDVPDGNGGHARWDDDRWRLDLGVGVRWTRRVLTKLAYQLNQSAGPITEGRQLVAVEAVVRF